MIYLQLFWEFFKIGLFAVGGGNATIPFLFSLSDRTAWYTNAELSNMIAISSSTPGAIGVNMSTYVGYKAVYNLIGSDLFSALAALLATLGVIIPGLIIIIIISHFLNKFSNNKYVNYVFYGLRAASGALIAYATYILIKVCTIPLIAHSNSGGFYEYMNSKASWLGDLSQWINYKSIIYAIILSFFVFKVKKHPVFYIIISAIVGILFKFAQY